MRIENPRTLYLLRPLCNMHAPPLPRVTVNLLQRSYFKRLPLALHKTP